MLTEMGVKMWQQGLQEYFMQRRKVRIVFINYFDEPSENSKSAHIILHSGLKSLLHHATSALVVLFLGDLYDKFYFKCHFEEVRI